MNLHRILLLAAAAHACALAAEFWVSREPAQWSGAEMRRMVMDSPWAKEASVALRGNSNPVMEPRRTAANRGPGLPESSTDQPSGSTPAALAGRDSTGDSGAAAPNIVVRWESATPICEACARGGMERYFFSCTSKLLYLSDLGSKFDELSREFYIVSMSNYPNTASAGQDGSAPQHSAAANTALERLGGRLQQATFLKLAAKAALRPSRVAALPAGRVLLVVFFFPRSEPITAHDKEVLMESSDGTMQIKAKFNLQKMVYKGRLDL